MDLCLSLPVRVVQRMLHMPQKRKATVPDSTLRMEMNALEEQADNAKARELHWKPHLMGKLTTKVDSLVSRENNFKDLRNSVGPDWIN